MNTKSQKQIKNLCLAAVMAALYVGLDYLAVSVSAPFGGTIKISFSGLPVIIVACIGGPLWAMATGFVGAFIGQILTYGLTATTLLWVLPAVVRGLAFGLLFIAFGRSIKPYIIIISALISGLLVTVVNTGVMYLDSKIYCYPVALFGTALIGRIVAAVLTAVVFSLILPPIIKAMKRFF